MKDELNKTEQRECECAPFWHRVCNAWQVPFGRVGKSFFSTIHGLAFGTFFLDY